MICIYSIKINGKFYIGQTVNVKNRRKYHINNLRNNKHYNSYLQRSYNKYNEFEFTIIEECLRTELNKKEQYYINFYDSYHNGFNATIGGDSEIDRIRKTSKEIYQYDIETGKLTYKCLGYMNMSRYAKINESNIRQVCYGKMKTCKGYHYSLVLKTPEEVLKDIIYINMTEEFRKEQSINSMGKNNPMYGKKRPDVTGDKNPYKKMIDAGYKPKKKIFKLTELEIIESYKTGKTQKEISIIAGCTQVHISETLIKHNIRKFKRKKVESPLVA